MTSLAAGFAGLIALYATQRLPYHEYATIHWLVFAASALAAVLSARQKAFGPTFVCAVAAIAFNPIFPARHPRRDWETIDWVTGVALLAVAAYSFYRSRLPAPAA